MDEPLPAASGETPAAPAPSAEQPSTAPPAPSESAVASVSEPAAAEAPKTLAEVLRAALKPETPAVPAAPEAPPPIEPPTPAPIEPPPELSPEIQALTEKAERFDHFQGRIAEFGLSEEHAVVGLKLASALVNGGQTAAETLTALRPFIEQLEIASGERLSADLVAAVEAGEMTEAHAQELSRARAMTRQHELRLDRLTNQQQQEAQQAAAQAHQQECHDAAKSWLDQKMSRDKATVERVLPVLNLKLETHFLKNGPPATKREWVDLHERFFNEAAAFVTPARAATAPAPSPTPRAATAPIAALSLRDTLAQTLGR